MKNVTIGYDSEKQLIVTKLHFFSVKHGYNEPPWPAKHNSL